MNGMVNSPDALGDDPCTVTGLRAIDEPREGLVELEITVGCGRGGKPVKGPHGRAARLGAGKGSRRLGRSGVVLRTG